MMDSYQNVLSVVARRLQECKSNGKKRFEVPGALAAQRLPSRRAKCGQPNQVKAMLKRLGK